MEGEREGVRKGRREGQRREERRCESYYLSITYKCVNIINILCCTPIKGLH